MTLLTIDSLQIHFMSDSGLIKAVNGLDLSVDEGETFCLIGESGCGKSVTAFSIMGLLGGVIDKIHGKIIFDGNELLNKKSEQDHSQTNFNGFSKKSKSAFDCARNRSISMIFQEPLTYLTPYYTVRQHFMEALAARNGEVNGSEKNEMIKNMLEKVRFAHPSEVLQLYPHQLSGGMAQRVLIALALINKPKLLIADEPTTALDATIQYQILELLMKLKEEFGITILLITHDIALAFNYSDSIGVMMAGKIIERGRKKDIFKQTDFHPYTRDLINSFALQGNRSSVVKSNEISEGCGYYTNCSLNKTSPEKCKFFVPQLFRPKENHLIRCWEYEDRSRG